MMATSKKRGTKTTKTPALHCSFCLKDRGEVGKLVAGPGVHICEACVGLCSRVLTGKPTAPFAGWASMTDEELEATLAASAGAVDSATENLREHVQALRRRGVSWERIASAIGISRQGAWERFSDES